MTVSGVAPIHSALMHALRHDPAGPASFPFENSKWLHEDFAPENVPYPLVTATPFPTNPRNYLWGSMMILVRYDVVAISRNSVEAENLDALIATALDDRALQVAGQSTLICRRVADLRSSDVDDEGKKVYLIGGTYEVVTDQPLPQTQTSSFTLDAVIV